MIGVTSFRSGSRCANRNNPEVFVRVTSRKKWIADNSIGSQESSCSSGAIQTPNQHPEVKHGFICQVEK